MKRYARFHIAMTVLSIVLIAPVLAAHPTRWNVTFAVAAIVGFWFWSPIACMLRRERREHEDRL